MSGPSVEAFYTRGTVNKTDPYYSLFYNYIFMIKFCSFTWDWIYL